MNTALAVGLFLIAAWATSGVLRSIRTVAARRREIPDPDEYVGAVVLIAAEVVVLVLAGMRLM